MKKTGLVLSILGVVAVLAIAAVAVIYGGSNVTGLNYVRLSVNPQIEFCCENDVVVALNPINEEAKDLCAQENFINLNIEDACTLFVDLCARSGYIDVEANDNAIKIDCVSGMSQSLEVRVYNTIQNYLKDNQILGAVIENSNDNAATKEAKEAGVSVDKYALIESLTNLDDSLSFNECKKYNQSMLIDKIKVIMQELRNPMEDYTEEELTNKRLLIDTNRVKFAKHLDAITDETKADFKELYAQNQKSLKDEVGGDFDATYSVWKNNHANFIS